MYLTILSEKNNNRVNILKSINEGPFQMGMIRETHAEGKEGALHLGPERPRVYSNISPEDKESCTMTLSTSAKTKEKPFTITMSVKLNRGLKESNYDQLYAYLKQHEENGEVLDEEQLLFIAGGHGDAVDEDVDEPPVQDLALNVDNVFQADEYDAFDFNVDEAPTAQTMFMANLSFADPIYDEAGPSYASDILSENRVGNVNPGQARQIKCYNCNGICHIEKNCTQPNRPQNSKYFKDKMLLMQAQENGEVLDEEQLLFIAGGHGDAVDEDVDEPPIQDLALNVDNVFQADEYNAFDFNVDEAPTVQTMFMANLSFVDPVYDEAGPSYASDILSEQALEQDDTSLSEDELDKEDVKSMRAKFVGDRSRLRNFVKTFIGTVRFGNDHFGAIMGYEDYVIGDSVISRNAPPTLKDPKFWTAKEKKTRKINRLARSLLIQGLPNDIYSLIDSNETTKDLWDALERQMRGSEYGEQDRKAAILYEYDTFKANEGERLLDTYLRDVNDALGYKKKAVVITSNPLALVAEKTNKITSLLEKAFNRRKFYSKPTNNNLRTSSTSQSENKKQEFVKTDDKKVEKKAHEKK
nr:integrase, catalytic region, zinc finger, CCHC-type, peptidase aspartic, catalytic [Tanacetum cinerariifolium]